MDKAKIDKASEEIKEAGETRRDIALARLTLISEFRKKGNSKDLIDRYQNETFNEGQFVKSLREVVKTVEEETRAAKKSIPKDMKFSKRWRLRRFLNEILSIMKAYGRQIEIYADGLRKERDVIMKTWKGAFISEEFLNQTYTAFLDEMREDEKLLKKLIKIKKHAAKISEASIFLTILDMIEKYLTAYLEVFKGPAIKSANIASKNFHQIEKCARRLKRLGSKVA